MWFESGEFKGECLVYRQNWKRGGLADFFRKNDPAPSSLATIPVVARDGIAEKNIVDGRSAADVIHNEWDALIQ